MRSETIAENQREAVSVMSLIGIASAETTMLVNGAVETLCFEVFRENSHSTASGSATD